MSYIAILESKNKSYITRPGRPYFTYRSALETRRITPKIPLSTIPCHLHQPPSITYSHIICEIDSFLEENESAVVCRSVIFAYLVCRSVIFDYYSPQTWSENQRNNVFWYRKSRIEICSTSNSTKHHLFQVTDTTFPWEKKGFRVI